MKFYRYEALNYIYGPKLILKEFKGIKETPCGWWIGTTPDFLSLPEDGKRWVSMSAKKRYAYPTIEQAQINFRARKNREIGILRAQLDSAEHQLILIKEVMRKPGESGQ